VCLDADPPCQTRVRARYSLPALAWTDVALGAGTVAKLAHVLELRERLASVYSAAGRGAPADSNSNAALAGAVIKAVDASELRNAIAAIW
jgi:hypothetical protein